MAQAMNCAQCGAMVAASYGPECVRRWCSQVCDKAWDEAHPGYWIKVEDMTREQRAELDAILGHFAGNA